MARRRRRKRREVEATDTLEHAPSMPTTTAQSCLGTTAYAVSLLIDRCAGRLTVVEHHKEQMAECTETIVCYKPRM